ncbi:hypothetical protein GF359_07180 [candidate division WOR-3 bacterium]|uniref:Tellurite resistance methyltransferase TehB-like domain-containing protein n=1 Tax=candidate division WOR-3 bacterium TaxID=2052148 RepID=A0A9D5K9Y2_UNCW3|nr:hypothetical protein [candidate division WOR-3 bacterium]MBD3364982.1 hypothetical protein [candidate division WOR-3 bacterium]
MNATRGKDWKGYPDLFLPKYVSMFPKGYVIDLGACTGSKGDNAIFLAEHGFEVEAFDRNTKLINELQEYAKGNNLTVRAIRNELTTLTIIPKRYSLALLTWSLMYIRKGERAGLVKMATKGLIPGGYIYLSAFSTEDPGFLICKDKLDEIEERTYFVPTRKMPVHFFDLDEMKELVDGLEIVAVKEGIEKDPNPKDDHFHGVVELLAKVPDK